VQLLERGNTIENEVYAINFAAPVCIDVCSPNTAVAVAAASWVGYESDLGHPASASK